MATYLWDQMDKADTRANNYIKLSSPRILFFIFLFLVLLFFVLFFLRLLRFVLFVVFVVWLVFLWRTCDLLESKQRQILKCCTKKVNTRTLNYRLSFGLSKATRKGSTNSNTKNREYHLLISQIHNLTQMHKCILCWSHRHNAMNQSLHFPFDHSTFDLPTYSKVLYTQYNAEQLHIIAWPLTTPLLRF